MPTDNIVQHVLKFKAGDYPRLAEKEDRSKRGVFTHWLCQLGEESLQDEKTVTLELLRTELLEIKQLLQGHREQLPVASVNPELDSALERLGNL